MKDIIEIMARAMNDKDPSTYDELPELHKLVLQQTARDSVKALKEAGYAIVPKQLLAEADFLCDRLSEFEIADTMTPDEIARQFYGHCDPPRARLKAAIKAGDKS